MIMIKSRWWFFPQIGDVVQEDHDNSSAKFSDEWIGIICW